MKTNFFTLLFILTSSYGMTQSNVIINGMELSVKTLKGIENNYGIHIKAGNYWYDQHCGAWGIKNGPTQGFIIAGLNVGGRLNNNASNGNTEVFVNNRELPYEDVRALQRIINVVPGRFWLDAQGNGGYEGQRATFNLVRLAKRQGNNSFYRNSYTGIGAGSSGGTSYVMGKDWSVIID